MAFGFGKKKRGPAGQAAAAVETAEEPADVTSAVDTADEVDETAVEEARGPWDAQEAPEGDKYLNLGSLLLPAREGITLKLKVNPEGTALIGLTASYKDSSLDLEAFAAPKSSGLWEVISQELIQADTAAKTQEGVFGTEIVSSVKLGGGRDIPTRIVGVDGPRWLLRGIFTGKAAVAGEQKEVLDEFFSAVVVDRGGEPIAPRDPLPLRPPLTAAQAAEAETAAEDEDAPGVPTKPDGPLTPTQQVDVQQTLARGPMFSEIR